MDNEKEIDFRAILRMAIRVITSPAAFFREMPKIGGFGEPIVFMMVMGLAAGTVNAVSGIIGLHIGVGVGTALASIIIYPLVGAVFGFIVAAVLFIIWKLLGSQESYETAYRCVAYLAALWPIMVVADVIPYSGALITIVLLTYFCVTASRETHKISSQKAWLVFGIIGAILIVMSFGYIIAQRAMMEESSKYRKQLEQSTQEMRKNSEEAQKSLEEMQKKLEKK